MPTKNKEKNREYQAKWYREHKETQVSRNKERRIKSRARLKEYKSKLKCEICGEKHPYCLDFHHRDPNEKEIAIHKIITKGWEWERIMKEISKCQVVCANCHRKIHWKNRME